MRPIASGIGLQQRGGMVISSWIASLKKVRMHSWQLYSLQSQGWIGSSSSFSGSQQYEQVIGVSSATFSETETLLLDVSIDILSSIKSL